MKLVSRLTESSRFCVWKQISLPGLLFFLYSYPRYLSKPSDKVAEYKNTCIILLQYISVCFFISPVRGIWLSAFIAFLVVLVKFNSTCCLMTLQKARFTSGLSRQWRLLMICRTACITCRNYPPVYALLI